jgi:hypothetical protein
MIKPLDNETLGAPQQIVFLAYHKSKLSTELSPLSNRVTLFLVQLRLLPNLKGKPFIYFLSEFFEKLICFNLIHVF